MKIALCQIDTTVGDFAGNARKIVEFGQRALAAGAELALFPELSVCGYPAEDLLLRPAFKARHDVALAEIAAALPAELPVLVGCLESAPGPAGRALHNAVALVHGGEWRIVARKSLLPTYDVFDESRYFEPWPTPEQNLVQIGGTKFGVVICEDGWNDAEFFEQRLYGLDPVERVVAAGAELVVNLSASPWAAGKVAFRGRMVEAASRRHGVPMIYVNLVGGDVELQFDGGSLAVQPTGAAFQPVVFEETMQIVDTSETWSERVAELPRVETHHRAIVQGIAAYVQKFGFDRVLVGLSGGIDSALVVTLAVDALGADRVAGVAMPSEFSSEHSVADARELAENLGIEFHVLAINELQSAFDATLLPLFRDTEFGVAEENLQSRIRGTLLMAYANKHGHLLLTTGNKSETAIGYCTLYGDTNGALAPIADLWKTEVWELSRWLNRDRVRIPQNSITKPPSAELRPDQLDTDSLPPYDVLDPVLRALIEEHRTVADVSAATGMPVEDVARLDALIQNSEFKRYQYAPTLRLSERCWRGRRMPVSHRFRDA